MKCKECGKSNCLTVSTKINDNSWSMEEIIKAKKAEAEKNWFEKKWNDPWNQKYWVYDSHNTFITNTPAYYKWNDPWNQKYWVYDSHNTFITNTPAYYFKYNTSTTGTNTIPTYFYDDPTYSYYKLNDFAVAKKDSNKEIK